jgi:gluconolactonase
MQRHGIGALAALFAALWIGGAAAQTATEATTLSLDPSFATLVSPDAKLRMLQTGYGFTEGVVWVDRGGYVLFSDIPANVIYKLTPDGAASVFMDRSGYRKYDIWRVGFMQSNGRKPDDPKFERFPMIGSNGLTLDPQGRLVIASGSGRSIDRIEANGDRTVLADRYDGKRFNGTNDVVVKQDGTVYFTDGWDGLREKDKDPARGLDFKGVFSLKDGIVRRIAEDIANPNGLALSPDQKTFYANGSGDKYVRAYDVGPDDQLSRSRMFIDMSADKTPGIADGMKVDVDGNVWESGPGGIWVVSPEGKHLGTIFTPELVGNLDFGDADHKTLYIAARQSIYTIRLNVAGIP